MEIKSYFANRVETAMDMARRDLGDDAVFLQSKRTTGADVALGRFEVVFGLANPVAAVEPLSAPPEEPEDDFLLRAAAAIADSAPIRNATPKATHPARPAASAPAPAPSPAPARQRIFSPKTVEPAPAAAPQAFRFQPGLTAFIGLPGAGKTTAIMKIAFALAAIKNQKVRIAEMQDPATGSDPQLRRFAEILNVPFVSRRQLTKEDLEHSSSLEHVLIDAPGLGPADGSTAHPLLRLFGQINRVQCHLVVPAWFSPAASPMVHVQALPYRPTHLLLTHAQDFTGEAAQTLAAAFRLPLSLLTTGREPQRGILNPSFSARDARSGRAA